MNADKRRCDTDKEQPAFSSKRSSFFIASFQIEGLCTAIRFTLQTNGEIGPQTINLLRGLRELLAASCDNEIEKQIPDISSDLSCSDLLAVAEVIRVTFLAFLSPEEATTQRGTLGFHASSK